MKKRRGLFLLLLAIVVVITAILIFAEKTRPKVDLTIRDLHVIHKNESTITFTCNISNIGENDINLEEFNVEGNDGIMARAYIAEQFSDPYSNASISNVYEVTSDSQLILAPGQVLTDTFVIDAPVHIDQGEYLIVNIDPEDILKEVDEENNSNYVPIYEKAERERMVLREIVPLQEYLEHFIYEFPHEAYMTRIPEGKSNLVFQQEYFLNDKVILLENKKLMGPLFGYAHSYKLIDQDIVWLTTSYTGEYGADTKISLYVINTTKNESSDSYFLSGYFGEDGWYNHQDGEFINDSTFQYRRYWNTDSGEDDSISRTIIIR